MPSPPVKRPSLIQELKESRRDIFKTVAPAASIALIGFLVAFLFIEPPPPSKIVIAAGPPDGAYHAAARAYASQLAEYGITLSIRETAGSVENYDVLLNDDEVQLAVVQGGTVPSGADVETLETLAALYTEPLWVFCRREAAIDQLADLVGKRIAVGAEGSGTRALAVRILDANGVRRGRANTRLLPDGGREAAALLTAGEVDAALFVLAVESPLIRELLVDQQLQLLPFPQARAYALRFPFLHDVALARGVVDLKADLPPADVPLVAPSAYLVATHDLHDAFIPLLMEAATEYHESGGLVDQAGKFPSLDDVELPPNVVALHHLEHGPSFSHTYFGFWISSLVDRAKIMIVPIILLLIPLVKLAPPVYRWQIRSRIYRWYALLREIDQSLRHDDAKLAASREKLDAIEKELDEVTVPLSFMEEFYHLRLHIDLVLRRLEERQSALDEREEGS